MAQTQQPDGRLKPSKHIPLKAGERPLDRPDRRYRAWLEDKEKVRMVGSIDLETVTMAPVQATWGMSG